MKKDYLEPQVILLKLLGEDLVRTSPVVAGTDNCESWLGSWSDGASQGGEE